MNRYSFIALDKQRQVRMLRLNGKILHKKLKREYTVSLYQLENFYIEIWEKSVRKQVLNLVTFKDKTLLNYQYNVPKEV